MPAVTPWLRSRAIHQRHLERTRNELEKGAAAADQAEKDGRELRTLSDAGELILRLPEIVQGSLKWDATELLMQAPKSGKKDHIADACTQLMRAAMTDGYAARR